MLYCCWQDVCGPQEKKFIVKKPKSAVLQYTIQLGDEAIVAPLSLFTPELFAATNSRGITTQERNMGDSEDPHDEHYLRETSVSMALGWLTNPARRTNNCLLFVTEEKRQSRTIWCWR